MELYSYNQYRGYHLFVEATQGDEYPCYDGVAQLNGDDIFCARGTTGDEAESWLMLQIDAELDEGIEGVKNV